MTGRQKLVYETAFDSKTNNFNKTLDLDLLSTIIMSQYCLNDPVSLDNQNQDFRSSKNQKNSDTLTKNFDLINYLAHHLKKFTTTEQKTNFLEGLTSKCISTAPTSQQFHFLTECIQHFPTIFNKKEMSRKSDFYLPKMIDCESNNKVKNILCRKIEDSTPFINEYSRNINKNISNEHRYCKGTNKCCGAQNNEIYSNSYQDNTSSSKIIEIEDKLVNNIDCKSFFNSNSIKTRCSDGSTESFNSSGTSDSFESISSEDRHRSSSSSSSCGTNFVPECSTNNFISNFKSKNENLNKIILAAVSNNSIQEEKITNSEYCKNNNSCEILTAPNNEKQQLNNSEENVLHHNNNIVDADAFSKTTNHHNSPNNQIYLRNKNKTSTKESQNINFNVAHFDVLRKHKSQEMQTNLNLIENLLTSTNSIMELTDLPFDMPKLKRRLKSLSAQADLALKFSSNNSSIENYLGNETDEKMGNLKAEENKPFNLRLNLNSIQNTVSAIDINLPLEQQGWYHGAITQAEAENELKNDKEGSYLVRNCKSIKNNYSLSLKSAKGFMHMKIQQTSDNKFILGHLSLSFDSIPEMINHYSCNQLPIRGAEHMCLMEPVIAQIL